MIEFILLLVAVVLLALAALEVGPRIQIAYLAAALVVTAIWLIPAGQVL